MPFPLAHAAAVLPLRRFCPRGFNFPALVIGSLSPDVGYAFGSLNVAAFSHRFWAGSLGFCLPVGLVLVWVFYLARLPLVQLLPAPYRQPFLTLCQRPAGPLLPIAVSLVLGAWTHQLLDALTHPELWLVHYLPLLLAPVLPAVWPRLQVCDMLYAGCTFSGVTWLAWVYLCWWQQTTGAVIRPGTQCGFALLPAGAILLIAVTRRGCGDLTGLTVTTVLSSVVVMGFLLGTALSFRPPQNPK